MGASGFPRPRFSLLSETFCAAEQDPCSQSVLPDITDPADDARLKTDPAEDARLNTDGTRLKDEAVRSGTDIVRWTCGAPEKSPLSTAEYPLGALEMVPPAQAAPGLSTICRAQAASTARGV